MLGLWTLRCCEHTHVKMREILGEVDGVLQLSPAPRFSRTAASISRGPAQHGEHLLEARCGWGFSADEFDKLHRGNAICKRPVAPVLSPFGDAARTRISVIRINELCCHQNSRAY